MKILIITRSYYPEKTIVNKIAEGLFKRGHNVTVLTAKPSFALGYILPGYQNMSYELSNGIRIHRVDVFPRRNSRHSLVMNDYTFYKNARKWVKKTKEKFDVVYTYCYSPVSNISAGNLYKKLHKVPHIAHVVEFSPDDALNRRFTFKYSLNYLFLYFYARHTYRKTDGLIIPSPVYEEYVRKVLKIKKLSMTYIPHTPLIEEGIVNPYIYKKGFNIVFYGDVDKTHILSILPEAMNKVARKDIYFHIIGKGKFSKDLLEQINNNHLDERIILHGDKPLADIPNCFTNADACYYSLTNKGYKGRAIDDKLIFMMSQKKPIIAVIEGDGEEVLKETGGGYILKDNVDDLVFAISKAASASKKEIETKGNNNYEYFLKHYQINTVVGEIESVLLKKCL